MKTSYDSRKQTPLIWKANLTCFHLKIINFFFQKGSFSSEPNPPPWLWGFKMLRLVVVTQTILEFSPRKLGKISSHFEGCICFRWVGSTTKQVGFFGGWDRPTTWPNLRCGMSEARTRSVLCGAIITKAKLLRFGTFWEVFSFFFGLTFVQLMVSCWVVWFGARWFGIGIGCPSTNPFHKGILGIQTTAPQTNN